MPNTHRFLQELARWVSVPFDPTTPAWQPLMHSATQKVLGKGALLLACGTRLYDPRKFKSSDPSA
jgi:hypothetical protein